MTADVRYYCVLQIDAATGEEETVGSVLTRSIRTARCFRRLGLQSGDVLTLGGRNHLDLRIPFYAALMAGLPVAGVDPFYKYSKLTGLGTGSAPIFLRACTKVFRVGDLRSKTQPLTFSYCVFISTREKAHALSRWGRQRYSSPRNTPFHYYFCNSLLRR